MDFFKKRGYSVKLEYAIREDGKTLGNPPPGAVERAMRDLASPIGPAGTATSARATNGAHVRKQRRK